MCRICSGHSASSVAFANPAVGMRVLGVSLIVLGAAFLFSGLVFLLPVGNKRTAPRKSFEQSQKRTEYYLQQMRNERGDLSL
jgi:hypothetical protein